MIENYIVSYVILPHGITDLTRSKKHELPLLLLVYSFSFSICSLLHDLFKYLISYSYNMNYEYDEVLTFKKSNVKKPKKKKVKERTIEDIKKEREKKQCLEDENKLKKEKLVKEEEKARLEKVKEIEKQVIDYDLNLLEEDLKDFKGTSSVKIVNDDDRDVEYDFM
jgi:hypothetical protein